MRAKISFVATNNGMIGYDYQYSLASMIYRKLNEYSPSTADQQHSKFGSKLYTFSGLIGTNPKKHEEGLAFPNGFFVISSPDSDFVMRISEAFLDHQEFTIRGPAGEALFIAEKVEILKPFFINTKYTFRTMSPIYVKTVREVKNAKREVDLYPNEPKFYERLHLNLLKKYELFYGQQAVDHFDFLKVHDVRTKRVRIGESYRRCSLMTAAIEGSKELLKFAYDAGLGEKTAMGFGCIDVIGSE